MYGPAGKMIAGLFFVYIVNLLAYVRLLFPQWTSEAGVRIL
jgi:hypothetical protein